MEFTVAKSDLQKELQLCQGVVERRSTIPILSNVLLKAGKDRIELAATDLDVTLQTACSAAVKQQGMVTIDAMSAAHPSRVSPLFVTRSTPWHWLHTTSTYALPFPSGSWTGRPWRPWADAERTELRQAVTTTIGSMRPLIMTPPSTITAPAPGVRGLRCETS